MRRWIILGVLAVLVASQCWGPRSWRLLSSRGMGLSGFVVEIRGRLVNGATGRPLAGLGVFALDYATQATETATLEAFAWRNAATRGAQAGGAAVDEQSLHAIYMSPDQHALSDADGRFQIKIMLTT